MPDEMREAADQLATFVLTLADNGNVTVLPDRQVAAV